MDKRLARRHMQRAYLMVRLEHRVATPAVAVGRVIGHIPVIKRCFGLRSVENETCEMNVPVGQN